MDLWSVYLVRTARGELYTGIALDVLERFAAHGAGRGARFLRGRGPLELVYRCRIGARGLALRAEHRLKHLTRAEKEALVARRPTRAPLLRQLALAPPRQRRDAQRSTTG